MANVKFSEFTSGTIAQVVGLDGGGANVRQSFSVADYMTKAVYDPQSSGWISGANNSGHLGGLLKMDASSDAAGGNFTANAGASAAGSINTSGGSSTTNAAGGNITTAGGAGANTAGGDIRTGGGSSLPGGSIVTEDGGGSISTRGTGTIELGANGTRTILNGGASSNRTITFMDADGTVANQAYVTIANALTQSSISPVGDGTYTVGIGGTQNGLITVASGVITGVTQAS